MLTPLLSVGIVCVIAGIIGGGLRALGVEIPAFASVKRQVMLVIFGLVLIFLNFQNEANKEKAKAAPDSGAANSNPTDSVPGTSHAEPSIPRPSVPENKTTTPDVG